MRIFKKKLKNEKDKSKYTYSHNNIWFCCALIILTGLTTGISFSKYTTTSTEDSIGEVARFIIKAVGDEQIEKSGMVINCNNGSTHASYNISVSNKNESETISDVSIKYGLIITFQQILPESLALTIDDKSGKLSEDGLTYTFEDLGTFIAGEENTNSHILKLIADPNTVSDISIKGIKVEIYAEQID